MGGLQQQLSICFLAVDIPLYITAFAGNSLILVALHKKSCLHPLSKLLYRSLATTDLLVGLVAQPLNSLCWMSVVQDLEPLSLRKGRRLRHKLCIDFSVFDDDDGHMRGQTSRPVVGAEIQTNCNFEAHVYYCNYLLGFYSCRLFKCNFLSPYNLFVQLPSYIILPGNIIRIVHKDFLHSQISPSTSTRSTTAEPNECTEHGAIQKGSAQCTVGAVSISCLLCRRVV